MTIMKNMIRILLQRYKSFLLQEALPFGREDIGKVVFGKPGGLPVRDHVERPGERVFAREYVVDRRFRERAAGIDLQRFHRRIEEAKAYVADRTRCLADRLLDSAIGVLFEHCPCVVATAHDTAGKEFTGT